MWYTRSGREYTGKIHRIIDENNARRQYRRVCDHCGGKGGSEAWAYTGYTCYKCGGSGNLGLTEEKLYSKTRLDKLNVMAEKRRAKALEKAKQKRAEHVKKIAALREEFEKQNPGFSESLRTFSYNSFLDKMSITLDELGHLSDRQLEISKEIIEKLKKQEAEKANSEFVGKEKERMTFVVTTSRVNVFERPKFGREHQTEICYAVSMKDDSGNTVVYIGASLKNLPESGQTAEIKATVKKHSEYRGEKQTIIQRPKLI